MQEIAKNDIEQYAKDFWKYASTTKGVHEIDDIFLDWSGKSDITINDFEQVWYKVSHDVADAFNIDNRTKKALTFKNVDEFLSLTDAIERKKEKGLPVTPEEEEAVAGAEELLAKTEGMEELGEGKGFPQKEGLQSKIEVPSMDIENKVPESNVLEKTEEIPKPQGGDTLTSLLSRDFK